MSTDSKNDNFQQDADPEIFMDINSDADIPGDNHLSNPLPEDEENEDEALKKLEDELLEQKDKYLRQAAEFDNFRRRTAKERLELSQTAGKDIILSLLEVLDDASRAQKQMEVSEDISQVREGNNLIFTKLNNILTHRGLTPMETIGQPFDVEKHEAITEVPVPDAMKGKVVDEVQKGYLLNDKIIRFAKVVVGK